MLRQSLPAVAAAVLLLCAPAGARAADMQVPPAYAPPPAVACGAPVVLSAPVARKHHHSKKVETDYVRIYTVTPYDPGCPTTPPAGIYVPPQTAYLASSPTRFIDCVWPCSDSRHHDWYDGKLWYYNAGTPNRPDVFMILQRN